MEDNSWIKLNKKFLHSPIWNYAIQTHMHHLISIWIYLLLSANWEDKKWFDGKQEVIIPKGSFITSINSLAEWTATTPMQARTALDHMQNMRMITRKTTNKWTQVFIVNWTKYQKGFDKDNKQDNKQITNKQQTNNKQITTTKEYKNIRHNSINTVRPSAKNAEIDYIIETYKKVFGYYPADKKPRYVAQNLRQSSKKLMTQLQGTEFKKSFEELIAAIFDWYDGSYDMKGETLEVIKRKAMTRLFPATLKKYDIKS